MIFFPLYATFRWSKDQLYVILRIITTLYFIIHDRKFNYNFVTNMTEIFQLMKIDLLIMLVDQWISIVITTERVITFPLSKYRALNVYLSLDQYLKVMRCEIWFNKEHWKIHAILIQVYNTNNGGITNITKHCANNNLMNGNVRTPKYCIHIWVLHFSMYKFVIIAHSLLKVLCTEFFTSCILSGLRLSLIMICWLHKQILLLI